MNPNQLIAAAFGKWDPAEDLLAALKFGLATILLDGDLAWLVEMLEASAPMELHGDGEWALVRRPIASYDNWPVWAEFRASVAPGLIGIQHVETYADMPIFLATLRSLLKQLNASEAIKDRPAFQRLVNSIGQASG